MWGCALLKHHTALNGNEEITVRDDLCIAKCNTLTDRLARELSQLFPSRRRQNGYPREKFLTEHLRSSKHHPAKCCRQHGFLR
jgi:hypothetical protein